MPAPTDPTGDEVIVKILASPINPSDKNMVSNYPVDFTALYGVCRLKAFMEPSQSFQQWLGRSVWV